MNKACILPSGSELLICLGLVFWNLIVSLLLTKILVLLHFLSVLLGFSQVSLYSFHIPPKSASLQARSIGIAVLSAGLHQHVKPHDGGEAQRVNVLKEGFGWYMFKRDLWNLSQLKLHVWNSLPSWGHQQGELFSSQHNKNAIVLCIAILDTLSLAVSNLSKNKREVFTLYFLYDHSCLRNLTRQTLLKEMNVKRKKITYKEQKRGQYVGFGEKKRLQEK